MSKLKIPQPTLWPTSRQAILNLAESWMDTSLVKINDDIIQSLSLPQITPGLESGMLDGKQSIDLMAVADLAITLGAINYRFWEPSENGIKRYTVDGKVGATAMRHAFESAWADSSSPLSAARDQGIPLSVADINKVFGDIPDPESRCIILNEVLLSTHRQVIAADLCAAGSFNVATAARLAEAFPTAYGDPVLKKAQLAVSDVWALAASRQPSISCDLTAFADYQIPSILRALGVLEYSTELSETIDNYRLIAADGAAERALRASAILAVEKIAERAAAPVAAVDHYLWTRRNEATKPFHLTSTTLY